MRALLIIFIVFYTVFQKRGHQTHGGNSVNSRPFLKKISLSNSPVNFQQSVIY